MLENRQEKELPIEKPGVAMKKSIPLDFHFLSPEDRLKCSEQFEKKVQSRRTIRDFSPETIDRKVIENCILAAGSAPSGANKQPYEFVVIQSPEIKREIRQAAEVEERAFYNGRASQKWLDDLEPFETNENKPFLETAPYLIAIFSKAYDIVDGDKKHNYYIQESTGLAVGTLITALHFSGLACLTHTPSPMKFLNQILQMPTHYKPFLLLVVGLPVENITVPNIQRKRLSDIACFK